MRSFSQCTVSWPRLVQTLTSFEVRPLSIEATAAAQEPLPGGQGLPDAPFPEQDLDLLPVDDPDELDVGLLGKEGMALDLGADLVPEDARGEEALDEDAAVGVPDVDAGDAIGLLLDGQGIIDDPVVVRPVVEGDLLRGEPGDAHVHAEREDVAVPGQELAGALPGRRLEEDAGSLDGPFVIERGGGAAQAVPRDLGLRAVGVEDAEADPAGLRVIDGDEEHAVGADAGVAVAELSD